LLTALAIACVNTLLETRPPTDDEGDKNVTASLREGLKEAFDKAEEDSEGIIDNRQLLVEEGIEEKEKLNCTTTGVSLTTRELSIEDSSSCCSCCWQ